MRLLLQSAKAEKPVDVPDVAGQEALSAERTLNGVKLNVKYGTEDYDEDIPKGAVKSQIQQQEGSIRG